MEKQRRVLVIYTLVGWVLAVHAAWLTFTISSGLREAIGVWLTRGDSNRYGSNAYSPFGGILMPVFAILSSWAVVLFVWTVRGEFKDRLRSQSLLSDRNE